MTALMRAQRVRQRGFVPGYRVGQFFAALSARRRPPDTAAANEVLPPSLLQLFRRMPPEDQRHGLEVLRRLRLAGERDPILLQAALLHDVGKAEAGVGLPHRIARVVLRSTVPPVWRRLAGRPTGWRRPFWVVANHPARGAVWVETAGGSSKLVDLIRWHEADAPDEWRATDAERRHAALRLVDASC